VNRAIGAVCGGLRLEITIALADDTLTGWNDHEYLFGNIYEAAFDAVPSP
jgi:hypothetical protein